MFSTGRTQFLAFISIAAAAGSAWVHRLQLMPVLPPESWANLCSWQGPRGAVTAQHRGKTSPAEPGNSRASSSTMTQQKPCVNVDLDAGASCASAQAEHGTLLSQEELPRCRAGSKSGATKSGENSSSKGRTSVIILIHSEECAKANPFL